MRPERLPHDDAFWRYANLLSSGTGSDFAAIPVPVAIDFADIFDNFQKIDGILNRAPVILFLLVGENVGGRFQKRIRIALDQVEDVLLANNDRAFFAVLPSSPPMVVPLVVIPVAPFFTIFRNDHGHLRFLAVPIAIPIPVSVPVAIAIPIPVSISVAVSISFVALISFISHKIQLSLIDLILLFVFS